MKTKWITYKGTRILLADFSNFGLDLEKAKEEMEAAIKYANCEPENSVLTLTDIRGTKGSPEMFEAMKATAGKITPFAKKRAIVGITGVQRIFVDMINKLSGNKVLVMFDNMETAKDWLVE
jgi:hypothetical protein